MSKTAVQLLTDFKAADQMLVDEWNATLRGRYLPSLEEQVVFLRQRLLMSTSALTGIVAALVHERENTAPALTPAQLKAQRPGRACAESPGSSPGLKAIDYTIR